MGPLPDAIRGLVDEDAAILEAPTRERLRELILREAVGLGPLEELLADPAVEEVMVNGHDRVYVERAGRIERTGGSFVSEQALRDAIERILTPLGRRVDELSPMVDARLEDGSRVHVVFPRWRSTARPCRSAVSRRSARDLGRWSSWGPSPRSSTTSLPRPSPHG